MREENAPVEIRRPWKLLPSPKERRLTLTLIYHWIELTKTPPAPEINDLRPEALEQEWPHSCLLSLPPGAPEGGWLFDHVGSALRAHQPSELIGRPVSAARPGTLLERLCRLAGAVPGLEAPLTEGAGLVDPGGATCLYRAIVLPFLSHGGGIHYLLGAASQKAVGKATPREQAAERYAFDLASWMFQPVPAARTGP